MQAKGRAVQQKLLASFAVIDRHPAASVNAGQKLVQTAMRVSAASGFAIHLKHKEVALNRERHATVDLTEAERAAGVVYSWQTP